MDFVESNFGKSKYVDLIIIIVEITAVERTIKRFDEFPHINEEKFLTIRGAKMENCTKKVKMYTLQEEFEEWAWAYLNVGYANALPDALEPVEAVTGVAGVEAVPIEAVA